MEPFIIIQHNPGTMTNPRRTFVGEFKHARAAFWFAHNKLGWKGLDLEISKPKVRSL